MRTPPHPPGYENRRDSKTYEIRATCSNCGERTDVDIPKGVMVKDYLKIQICPNCECREVLEFE